MTSSLRSLLPVVPVAVALVAVLTGTPRRAVAEPATADLAEKAERCTTRVYTAMVGDGAPATALAQPNPQATFDALVKDPRFQDRFARFINAQFNPTPGATPAEDGAYYMTKFILTQDKPWSDAFVGRYDVAPQDPTKADSEAVVTPSPEGLGYFHSRAWMVRYAGNEGAGIRIKAAYRMMQNTIGLKISATTSLPDADVSAGGRQAVQCAGCHYQPWFALDKVATVFGKKSGMGVDTKFAASTEGAQTILGGITISNDRELAEALVANEAFNVNTCRLAFRYLYGRLENSCEGPLFDQCVEAFKKDKKITSALAVVAKDPTFCE
jgi:hypothetical protein